MIYPILRPLFFSFLLVLSSVTSIAQTVNFPGGRIAFSSDGNQHDKDDWGATALSLALIDAAGLNSRVVHYDHSNHLGDNNPSMENRMIESAEQGALRFNLDTSVFFNDQRELEAAIQNLAAAINASSAEDPLWILAAGPMETVWRGIQAAEAESRQFVTVISHSTWNQNHDDTPEMSHNWDDLLTDFAGDGVFFVQSSKEDISAAVLADPNKLPDQNTSNGDFDFNTPEASWHWLRDSPNPDWQWLFEQNGKNTFDVSDAGMTYFLITGGPQNGGCKTCGVQEARDLLENPVEKEKFFIEKDNYICFEVEESTSDTGLWVSRTSVSNYTGTGHLEFTGNTINGGDPKSPLEYKIKVNNPGRYRLVIRAHKRLEGAEPDKCNDGWVKMDGDLSRNSAEEIVRLSAYTKFFGGASGGWGWAEKLDEGHTKYNAEYELQAGIYTFTIAGRSIRWNIDRVVFFDVSRYSLDWAKNTSLAATPIEQGGFYYEPDPPLGPNSTCVEPSIEGGNGLDTLLQFAYQSAPQVIPGKVWAWKFDQGGEGIAYHDSDAGNNGSDWGNPLRNEEDVDLLDKNGDGIPETGWTEVGEWLEYTVRVLESGNYKVKVSAASSEGGNSVYFKVDNSYRSCNIELKSTGNLKTYGLATGYDSIPLSKGTHTLSVVSQSSQLNLESFTFTRVGEYSAPLGIVTQDQFLRLYPNPARDQLILKVEHPLNAWVRIYDLAGHPVLERRIDDANGEIVLPTGHLSPGSYILKLDGKEKNYRSMFLIAD